MTKQEALATAKATLLLVDNAYPAFNPKSKEMAVNVYAMAFADSGLSPADIEAGVRKLMAGGSEYAPSTAAIINAARAAKEEKKRLERESELERMAVWLEEHSHELFEATEEDEPEQSEEEKRKVEERSKRIRALYKRQPGTSAGV